SLFVPRAEIKAHVRSEMAKEAGDFAAVASKRRAERVAGAGNVLDVDRNKEMATQAERAKNVFDHLVNRKGMISDAVNDAALAYAKAKTKRERDAVKQQAVEAARGAVLRELGVEPAGAGQSGQGSAPAPGAQPPGGAAGVPADAGRGSAGQAGLNAHKAVLDAFRAADP